MNAVDWLVSQHRDLEKLLKKLVDAKGEEQVASFREATDFLVTHVTVEEEIFYPAVKAQRTEDILLESLEEHLSLKRVVADLLVMKPDDRQFEPKLHVLKEQAEHHHEEEEEHLFPKVRKHLDDERLDALGREMDQRAKELRQGKPRRLVLNQTDQAASLD